MLLLLLLAKSNQQPHTNAMNTKEVEAHITHTRQRLLMLNHDLTKAVKEQSTATLAALMADSDRHPYGSGFPSAVAMSELQARDKKAFSKVVMENKSWVEAFKNTP